MGCWLYIAAFEDVEKVGQKWKDSMRLSLLLLLPQIELVEARMLLKSEDTFTPQTYPPALVIISIFFQYQLIWRLGALGLVFC